MRAASASRRGRQPASLLPLLPVEPELLLEVVPLVLLPDALPLLEPAPLEPLAALPELDEAAVPLQPTAARQERARTSVRMAAQGAATPEMAQASGSESPRGLAANGADDFCDAGCGREADPPRTSGPGARAHSQPRRTQ